MPDREELVQIPPMFKDWNTSRFPELQRFDEPKAQSAALDQAHRRAFRSWQVWAKLILISGVAQIIGQFSVVAFIHVFQIGKHDRLIGQVGAGVAGSFSWLVLLWLIRHSVTRNLREALNQTGRPTCMACGYDLRGQVEAAEPGSDVRCPECGTVRRAIDHDRPPDAKSRPTRPRHDTDDAA